MASCTHCEKRFKEKKRNYIKADRYYEKDKIPGPFYPADLSGDVYILSTIFICDECLKLLKLKQKKGALI